MSKCTIDGCDRARRQMGMCMRHVYEKHPELREIDREKHRRWHQNDKKRRAARGKGFFYGMGVQ